MPRRRHQRLHGIYLRRGGLSIRHAHDGLAHGTLADEQGGVGADALLGPLVQRIANFYRAASIVAGGYRRHALHQVRIVAASRRVGRVLKGVRMGIDKSRRDYQTVGINDATGFLLEVFSNQDDSVPANANIHLLGRRAGAIQNRAVTNQEDPGSAPTTGSPGKKGEVLRKSWKPSPPPKSVQKYRVPHSNILAFSLLIP